MNSIPQSQSFLDQKNASRPQYRKTIQNLKTFMGRGYKIYVNELTPQGDYTS